ncbi:hypothetical protein [Streptomyces tubercidicus]|uniref:hypothetical protein n=1 Tax=Streptomyces tubercidicus TaxID=47759 RepID=UPI003467C57C
MVSVSSIGVARQHERAVGLARSALAPVHEDLTTLAIYNQARNKPPKDHGQEGHWAMRIQSAFDLFSGAPHDDIGTTGHFTWTYNDAVAAVATATGLLARLDELKRA